MGYSVESRDRIFGKGFGFLSFAKTMGKNICKNVIKNLIGKCIQKLYDHAKKIHLKKFFKKSSWFDW